MGLGLERVRVKIQKSEMRPGPPKYNFTDGHSVTDGHSTGPRAGQAWPGAWAFAEDSAATNMLQRHGDN